MSLNNRLKGIKKSSHVEKESPYKKDNPYKELKVRVQNNVIENIDIDFTDVNKNYEKNKDKIEKTILEAVEKESLNMTTIQRNRLISELMDEIVGFGPITSLLNDPDITEVMVNGPDQVYIEREGKLVLTNAKFKNNDHIYHVIK